VWTFKGTVADDNITPPVPATTRVPGPVTAP